MPIGQVPGSYGLRPLGPMVGSRTVQANIKDLARERSMPKQNFNFQRKATFESAKKINQMLGFKKKTNWRF
jgi:hypothetical protein